MNELKLFDDSEVFTKHRPTITEAQKQEFYLKVAQEIVDKKWTKYSEPLESMAEIIADIFDEDADAFDLAKDFDDAYFKVGKNFVDAIEDWQNDYRNIVNNNVSTWIHIHNIKPKYKTGDKVMFKNDVFPYFKKDEIVSIYVSPILNMAKYSVKNMLIEYEIIEQHTELVK